MAAKRKTTKKAEKKDASIASKKKTNLEDIENFTTGKMDDDAIEKVKSLKKFWALKL
jgi:hypothetical protein